jgi:magnesium transporter
MGKIRELDVLKKEFEELIQSKDLPRIKEFIYSENPADLAELLDESSPETISRLIALTDQERQADLIEAFDLSDQVDIILRTEPERGARIIEKMAHDDRADLVSSLPEKAQTRLLELVEPNERADINRLMSFPEDSAGSIMTTDYATISADMTVEQAIEKLRSIASDAETIFYVYVLDKRGCLLGIVSLRYLIFSEPKKKIREIMYSDNIATVRPDTDREEVADIISKYDLLAMPVTIPYSEVVKAGAASENSDSHDEDTSGFMLGIVTVDDVLDVIEEEATEDFYRMGAAGSPSEEDYLSVPILTMARQRITWLIFLVFVGFVSGYIMEQFSGMLSSLVSLTFFIPLLCASGGNAGSQATTVVIRSLSTGEIDVDDIKKVLFKELGIAFLVGSALGICAAFRAILMNNDYRLGLTVALAMLTTILIAKAIGATLPIFLHKIGMDPAIMSAPLISTILDVTTLLVYFYLAGLIMMPG